MFELVWSVLLISSAVTIFQSIGNMAVVWNSMCVRLQETGGWLIDGGWEGRMHVVD